MSYFLMKAQTIDTPARFGHGNWLMSVKLDGIRAFWDGGVTRGRFDVPWNLGKLSTGLWTNNGKPIYPPEHWLECMPERPVDGELWCGPGNFQRVTSICRKKVPTPEWYSVSFVEHTPITMGQFLFPRSVKTNHCAFTFTDTTTAYMQRCAQESIHRHIVTGPDIFYPVEKRLVSVHDWDWIWNEEFPRILELGHEGLVFHRADIKWEPVRSWSLLKLKPFRDAEGIVVGCVSGRDTDKGGKLRGMMGALVLLWEGKKFLLSGFTDAERSLTGTQGDVRATEYAYTNPGELMPATIFAKNFPSGTKVTFKYRELTDDGLPKEARYWRKRQ